MKSQLSCLKENKHDCMFCTVSTSLFIIKNKETAQNRVISMYTLIPIAGLSESESKRLASGHYIAIDVPQPLTNDLWVFLFQTIDAEFVK